MIPFQNSSNSKDMKDVGRYPSHENRVNARKEILTEQFDNDTIKLSRTVGLKIHRATQQKARRLETISQIAHKAYVIGKQVNETKHKLETSQEVNLLENTSIKRDKHQHAILLKKHMNDQKSELARTCTESLNVVKERKQILQTNALDEKKLRIEKETLKERTAEYNRNTHILHIIKKQAHLQGRE
ncbi:hypothetical protein BC833DRAFT_576869 [Globomyces pollinis-pini]|nr:hypothetical protein BC833DRAFT_576869 [Globomyces pollinis-pini]